MKKTTFVFTGLMTVACVFGQNEKKPAACDCPSCVAAATGGKVPYTLAALQELNGHSATVESAAPHEDCDHGHVGRDHDSHEDHDHGEHADHESHSYDKAEGVELSEKMIQKAGIKVGTAGGGTIAKTSIFPAEIKLNRDSAAAVSPRYPSVVRQVFAEIGDTVKKGDILASLENRDTLAVYTVSAPRDGVIIGKDVAVGEIAPDNRILFEVADLSTVWVDISIFPRYQHLLRQGMPVEFTAHDGHSAQGTVQYISPIMSHETRTFTARCVLEGADEDFTPGAFVRARLAIESAEVAVAISRGAVQTLEGETVVFVPGEHGFLPVEVETGLADESLIEIKSGLLPGETYVAEGAFALKAQLVTSGMDPHAGHGH
jgi:cobalt-zinc-cadmium efflux system membrane fusion protein